MAQRRKEGESSRATTERSRRSRGFGGCTTCRRKRMRCDERKPQCTTCINYELPCTYEKHLFFDMDGELGGGEGRYRRPILTEEERSRMSQALTGSVGSSSALDVLFAIDEECDRAGPVEDLQVCHGPFGAFRSTQSVPAPDPDPTELANNLENVSSDDHIDFDAFSASQLASPTSLALASTLFEEPDLTGLQSSMPDFWDFQISGSRVQEIFDDLPLAGVQHMPLGSTGPGGSEVSQAQTAFHDSPGPKFGSLDLWAPLNNDNFVLNEAVPLLKHYQTTVLRALTPFRHSKTPWHVLFLPQAKNCLAAFTLGEQVDHATLSSFYGTLAISAFSMDGVYADSKWRETAKHYKQLARQHMKSTLQTAYDVPKRAKYKAILIALLTLVQLSVLCGNSDQTETYFLEAEKFIRLRGLCKRKSRKVRLLHHCYAFERILYETTLLTGPTGNHRHHVRKAIETSGTVVAGQDALSFRLGHWTDLELAMRRIKCQEEGENDLHLQNPGAWSATLYPEIFGVPEQILLMLSLIVRLAKEKEHGEHAVGLTISEFLERAKAIEQLIQRMDRPAGTADADASNLQEAMRLALSIYFYRRIYDVDSSVLQDKVMGVFGCLVQARSVQADDSFGAVRYNWPAFIAAREATDPIAQASFSAWFQEAAKQTGLRFGPEVFSCEDLPS